MPLLLLKFKFKLWKNNEKLKNDIIFTE